MAMAELRFAFLLSFSLVASVVPHFLDIVFRSRTKLVWGARMTCDMGRELWV